MDIKNINGVLVQIPSGTYTDNNGPCKSCNFKDRNFSNYCCSCEGKESCVNPLRNAKGKGVTVVYGSMNGYKGLLWQDAQGTIITQSLPSGNYQKYCSGCIFDGDVLRCDYCLNTQKSKVQNRSLILNGTGGISDINGTLTQAPPGSYIGSCNYCSFKDDRADNYCCSCDTGKYYMHTGPMGERYPRKIGHSSCVNPLRPDGTRNVVNDKGTMKWEGTF